MIQYQLMKTRAKNNLIFAFTGIATIALLSFVVDTKLKAENYAETARGVDVYIVSPQKTTPNASFTADILITNDRTPLNAMEAEIYFDPTAFAVERFEFGTSLCEERFIIDNVVDNQTGRVHVSCGTITPFTGNATIFGTIIATPLKPGVTNVIFGEKTHVHVHDGLGTEIARDTYGTTIAVEAET